MKKYKILVVICSLLLLTGCEAKKLSEVTDQEKIAIEYTIPKNNPFEYASLAEVKTILEQGGIIFFASPEDDRSKELMEILTLASKKGKQTIYYINPKQMKEKAQNALLKSLKVEQLSVPSLYIAKDKTVTEVKTDFLKRDKQDLLTTEEKQAFVSIYQEVLEER